MSEILVEKEIIAYGPLASISGKIINLPVKPRSLKFFVDSGLSQLLTGYDDGTGNIIGSGVAGTVKYDTGDFSVNLSTAIPDDMHTGWISYSYISVGVSELNKVIYSEQDFQTLVESLKQFLRKNYPSEYNDYINSSFGMALLDINAYVGNNLSWYLNRKITDLYFPTAKTPNSVSKLSRLLGYKPRGAFSSQTQIVVSFKNGAYSFPIQIKKPFAFSGPNGLQFEYRGSLPITFLPGETTKSIDISEGETVVENFISTGETNQVFILRQVPEGKFVEQDSIIVKVNGVEWDEYPIIPFKTVEGYESLITTYPPYIKFGDAVQGVIPASGDLIEVQYVICSGFSGRISSNSITAPVIDLSANFNEIPLTIVHPSASVGGDDPEDLKSITTNAPLFQKTQDRALTKSDYDFIGNTFPNVAKSDAQVIRTIAGDLFLQQFFADFKTDIITLKNSDRYLLPRPQIEKLSFSNNLFEGNVVSLNIDSTTISVGFDGSNEKALQDIAASIATHPKIAKAEVGPYGDGNVIIVTGKPNVTFVISAYSVQGGVVPGVIVAQSVPPPNQIQYISFDRDIFRGNLVHVVYDSVPISVPFDTDSITTINNLATSIRNFARVPTIETNYAQPYPNQKISLIFSRALFKGCLISITLLDNSTNTQSNVKVNWRTDNDTTYTDLASALSNMSLVASAIPFGISDYRQIDVMIDASIPSDSSNELLGYTNGTSTTYNFTAFKRNLSPGTIVIIKGSSAYIDNGSGSISDPGSVSGTVNYSTGQITLVFPTAPTAGDKITISYNYRDMTRTIEVVQAIVTTNTVTVDEATRTINVVTDGNGSLVISSNPSETYVSGLNPPVLSVSQLQFMIDEDLGSVGQIADRMLNNANIMREYLDDTLSDGCKSNTVQVSILGKSADKRYAAPTQTIIDSLKSYLDERKDIVHKVQVVSGYSKIISVNLTVEVQVNKNARQEDVINNIERALIRSDVIPYGLLVEREFNKSLYISDIFDAINLYVSEQDRDYLNIVITGPKKHETGIIEDEIVQIGDGINPVVVTDLKLNYSPIVESELKIYVDGVQIGEDNGEGSIITYLNVPAYTCIGIVDYLNGKVSFEVNPAPPLNKKVTVTYYQSKIDSRGNYLCPKGYVLQYGDVTVLPIIRVE